LSGKREVWADGGRGLGNTRTNTRIFKGTSFNATGIPLREEFGVEIGTVADVVLLIAADELGCEVVAPRPAAGHAEDGDYMTDLGGNGSNRN
jgi:hypothetical protein